MSITHTGTQTKTEIPPQVFRVSLFKSKFDNEPKAATITYDKLCEMASKPEIRADKDGPLFSGASYPKDATRANENVIEISFLGLDYDHGADFDKDCHTWRDLDLAYVAYTTHSSYRVTERNPDAEERLRVILPLATPVPAAQYRLLWHWAQRHSGGRLDESRKDESGMFYRPAKVSADAPYRHESREGQLLDWRALDLREPEPEPPPEPEPAPKTSAGSATNGHYNGNGQNPRYVEAAFKAEIDRVASALDGGRNTQLNKSAFALGRFVGAGALNRGDAEAELERAAISCGLDQDREGGGIAGVRRTIKSGLDNGEKEPRTIPEPKPQRKASTEPAETVTADAKAEEDESPGAILGLQSAVFDDDQILTDFGNAARFYNAYSRLTRHVEERKKFYSYDGKRWSDKQALVESRAKQAINDLRIEAMKEADKEKSLEIFEYAVKCQKPERVRAILELVRSEIRIDFEAFDADPEVFNVANGTIHLPTGDFREHDPKDLCTKISKVKFDKDAKCPTWRNFLQGIFNNDQELIKFIQKAVGYSASGLTVEQVFFLLYGIGKNGKTTFVNVVARLFGEYAAHAQMDLFTPQNRGGNGHNEELANLAGARTVTAIETEESKRLSEALIKQITGGDPVTASRKHEHAITFRPQFKLWLAANHKPVIRGTDDGIWRRPLLIPFLVQFEKDHDKAEREGLQKADKHLESKLFAELSGILNWAIEGFKLYKNEGLNPPDSVRMATQKFREESDLLGAFVAENLESRKPKKGEPDGEGATKIYKAYSAWCEENGERAISQTRFGKSMVDRGYEKGRDASANTVVYLNLFFLPERTTQEGGSGGSGGSGG